MSETKKRNPNLELVRVISICLVIMAHTMDKGGLLPNPIAEGRANFFITWFLEVICCVSINLFILVSGYVMAHSKFRSARLFELIMDAVFYSFGGYLIFSRMPFIDTTAFNKNLFFRCMFPIHQNTYWFMTSYVIVYLFFPIIKRAAEVMQKKQLEAVLILLIVWECVVKSSLPISLDHDDLGQGPMWFFIVFLLGIYIRKFEDCFSKSKSRYFLYAFLSVLGGWLEIVVLSLIYTKTGRLEDIWKISVNHNHIFILLAGFFGFLGFLKMKEIKGWFAKFIVAISPMTLGVYLFHETPVLRMQWPGLIGVPKLYEKPWYGMLLGIIGAVFLVYAVGTVVDFARIWLFKGIGALLKKTPLSSLSKKIDEAANDFAKEVTK